MVDPVLPPKVKIKNCTSSVYSRLYGTSQGHRHSNNTFSIQMKADFSSFFRRNQSRQSGWAWASSDHCFQCLGNSTRNGEPWTLDLLQAFSKSHKTKWSNQWSGQFTVFSVDGAIFIATSELQDIFTRNHKRVEQKGRNGLIFGQNIPYENSEVVF